MVKVVNEGDVFGEQDVDGDLRAVFGRREFANDLDAIKVNGGDGRQGSGDRCGGARNVAIDRCGLGEGGVAKEDVISLDGDDFADRRDREDFRAGSGRGSVVVKAANRGRPSLLIENVDEVGGCADGGGIPEAVDDGVAGF